MANEAITFFYSVLIINIRFFDVTICFGCIERES
jgi:hypothetical protein